METPNVPAEATPPPAITFAEFQKVTMKVGRVLRAEVHPQADKLLILQVDFGTESRQIIAGVRPHYAPEALVGKDVVAVLNLEPRKMRGEMSYGMLLACSDGAGVSLLTTDRPVAAGGSVG